MPRILALFTLAACATSSLKSSGNHIDTANDALARADYDTAEKEFATARQRAEGAGAAWVRSEAARGEAKIGIAKLRRRMPDLRAPTTFHAVRINDLHGIREKLRALGGDAALDAELVTILGEHAERWIADAEARAGRGELYAAANAARPLLSLLDMPTAVVARTRTLQDTAAKASRARATAGGDGHPLTRRLHLALAASYAGGEVADAGPLLAPYQRGVEVAIAAPPSCPLAALPLAQPGRTRRASVAVTITTCTATETTADSTETATWTEEVLDHYDTVMVSQQKCEPVCGSVLSGGETCSTNYNTNPPSLLCTKNTITKCYDRCETVQVPKQEPRYRTENREDKRRVTTRSSTATVIGTWVVRRDGQEWTGSIRETSGSRLVSAPAVGKAPARSTGSFASPAELLEAARKSTAAEIQRKLELVFAMDIDRAVAAGRAAAGTIDPEEESWIRAVALGGTDPGPLAARYDLDRDRVQSLLQQTAFAPAAAPGALPDATVFAVVARDETETITDRDRNALATAVPPVFGGKYWLQLDGSRLSLPVVTDASGRMGSGDSAVVVGVRAATRVLGRKESMWGWRLADELSMAFGVGGRTGGPDVMGEAIASLAGTVSGHYALGVGYRKPGKGALFAGIRGTYEAFLVGTSSGSYTTLPLFARVEIPLTIGTLSGELLGFSLAGSSQYGLSIHLSSKRRHMDTRLKYFQLRIEQTSVDVSVQDFDTGDGSRSLGALDLTAVHLMYGIGI